MHAHSRVWAPPSDKQIFKHRINKLQCQLYDCHQCTHSTHAHTHTHRRKKPISYSLLNYLKIYHLCSPKDLSCFLSYILCPPHNKQFIIAQTLPVSSYFHTSAPSIPFTGNPSYPSQPSYFCSFLSLSAYDGMGGEPFALDLIPNPKRPQIYLQVESYRERERCYISWC